MGPQDTGVVRVPADKVVIVHWGDAWIDTDDFEVSDAKNTRPVRRRTVGFLIAKNQHGVTLATDFYSDPADKGTAAARMFIPKGMVEKIEER